MRKLTLPALVCCLLCLAAYGAALVCTDSLKPDKTFHIICWSIIGFLLLFCLLTPWIPRQVFNTPAYWKEDAHWPEGIVRVRAGMLYMTASLGLMAILIMADSEVASILILLSSVVAMFCLLRIPKDRQKNIPAEIPLQTPRGKSLAIAWIIFGIALLGFVCAGFWAWHVLPEGPVPVHFSLDGTINRCEEKADALLPLFGLGTLLGIGSAVGSVATRKIPPYFFTAPPHWKTPSDLSVLRRRTEVFLLYTGVFTLLLFGDIFPPIVEGARTGKAPASMLPIILLGSCALVLYMAFTYLMPPKAAKNSD